MVVDARTLVPAKEPAPGLTAEADLRGLIPGFPSEEGCRAFLEQVRWPEGVRCPRCGASRGISRIESRGQFECDACGYQFSVRVGTAFHASHLPLWKWFMAVHIVTTSDEHVSANQLKRTIGVSYKTAWHLCSVIRPARPGDRENAFGDTLLRLIGAETALVASG
jgi:transposase-like protein